MRIGRLLLLAGAALAANQFLKTEKGKQVKRNVTDQAGRLKTKITDMVDKSKNGMNDTFSSSNPTGSSYTGGTGPM